MKIIITIPAYNEEKSIGYVIKNIKEIMKNMGYSYKILVVDDGSRDQTAEIARKEGAVVYSHNYNFGLAETFRSEIIKCLELKADMIIHFDADGQYLTKDIPKLIKEIENGYDLVLGSRFLGHIESMPFIKRCGNKAFSKIVSRIIHYKISDCQTGFRAFTKEVAKEIKIISDHTYTQEQIIKAVKQKFKIKEVPVYFARRIFGKSRLMSNPFNYALRAWINIFRIYRDYEPLKFFGKIGTGFFFSGFLIGLWLFFLFLSKGYISHYPSIILSVLLMLTGIQIITFGFLADMRKNQN